MLWHGKRFVFHPDPTDAFNHKIKFLGPNVLVQRVGAFGRQPLEQRQAAEALATRRWGNFALVFLFSSALRVYLVSSVSCVILLVLRFLSATSSVAHGFVTGQPKALARCLLCGQDRVVTTGLLR